MKDGQRKWESTRQSELVDVEMQYARKVVKALEKASNEMPNTISAKLEEIRKAALRSKKSL